MNPGSRRQRGIGGENKKIRGSFVPDEIQSTIVHVLLHELTMREDGLQAHLQGFSTTDTYKITTVHSSSTSDERTFIICSKCCSTCCTPSNSLLLNWFVARFVLCFYRSERRLSRGGRGVFFRRLRNFYNKKGYYQWATWQMMLNEWICLFIYTFIIYLFM